MNITAVLIIKGERYRDTDTKRPCDDGEIEMLPLQTKETRNYQSVRGKERFFPTVSEGVY